MPDIGVVVDGRVAPGFDPVADELARAVAAGTELGAAVAVFLDGQPVVDIWAGDAEPGRPWRRDTLCVTMSASKGVAALCAQILADRGLLDVDAPVTRYWPEFAPGGKDTTLVRHVLSHTHGLLTFPRYQEVVGESGKELADHALIARRLAAAPPSWPPGARFLYSPLIFGFLIAELMRRVDGRTIGRFVADEIAAPLGVDLWIGLPDGADARIAPLLPPDPNEQPQLSRLQAAVDARARKLIRAGAELDPEASVYAGLFLHPDFETPAGTCRGCLMTP